MDHLNGIRAIYFDMGGVLMDIADGYKRQDALLHSLQSPEVRAFLGTDFDEYQYQKLISSTIDEQYYGTNAQPDAWVTVTSLLEQFVGREIPYPIVHRIFWDYIRYFQNFLEIKPETHGVLEYCRNKGYIIGLISNVFHPSIAYKEMFTKWRIIRYFNPLVFSSDLKVKKPDPWIFEYALSFHPGLRPEECVFIGDTYYIDVRGALDSNMIPVWLNAAKSGENVERVLEISTLSDLMQLI